jgi:hypothetical protein
MEKWAAIPGIMLTGLMLYLGIVLFIFFLRRRGILPGGRPSYRRLGNALLHLQYLAQPEKQYILEETEDEHVEQDDEGGPDDPTAHLQRHAGRRARYRTSRKVSQRWK